ncbi:hypothetical protein ADK59_38420 [Streptomyces sp. XY332]|nr:hypothetical protein [Streptomyces sp. XY332]KOY50165.1 hypothetical protein ADK59_38420 [Streptomyces sp. XY332]
MEHSHQDSVGRGEFGFGTCARGHQALVTATSAEHALALNLRLGSQGVDELAELLAGHTAAADTAVVTVESSAPNHGLEQRGLTFQGFRAAYSATTGQLLDACWGATTVFEVMTASTSLSMNASGSCRWCSLPSRVAPLICEPSGLQDQPAAGFRRIWVIPRTGCGGPLGSA